MTALPRSAALGKGLLCCLLFGLSTIACSDRDYGPEGKADGGNGGETNQNDGGDETGGSSGSGSGGSNAELCDVRLAPPRLALFVLAERSSAMTTAFAGKSEAIAQREALVEFFDDPANAEKISVATTLWPANAGDYCDANLYAADLEVVAALPEGGASLSTRLSEDAPSGNPGSAGALTAAFTAASAYQSAHPDASAEVVFLVGNFGGTCDASDASAIADLLATARDDGTRTWIVPGRALSSAQHAALSEAGGGVQLSDSRSAAFDQLPARARACRFLLDGASDPFVGDLQLREVADAATCSDSLDEYFLNAAKHLVLCPATCASVGLQRVEARATCAAD